MHHATATRNDLAHHLNESTMSSLVPDITPRIAVLVPCYNEALTVMDVIDGFRAALPNAEIYVFDNNSSDGTADVARKAGAIVRTETRQGKGNVVNRMFSDVEADIYIMVDGDATYDAKVVGRLIDEVRAGPYDMVNVARLAESSSAYRSGHAMGNKLMTGLVQLIFGTATTDMLSGYKAFSRRYVNAKITNKIERFFIIIYYSLFYKMYSKLYIECIV